MDYTIHYIKKFSDQQEEKVYQAREENTNNPNYPIVFWLSVNKLLYVKVGDFEKVLTPDEALILFKDNAYFGAEYNLLTSAAEKYIDAVNSHNTRRM